MQQVDETLLGEMLSCQLDSLHHSELGRIYHALVSQNNFHNTEYDRLYSNTLQYLESSFALGDESPNIYDVVVATSVQAHIANYVEKIPQLVQQLHPRDIAKLRAYSNSRETMREIISFHQAEEQQYQAENKYNPTTRRRARRRKDVDAPMDDNQTEDQFAPRRLRGRKQQRVADTPAPRVKGSALRDSVQVSKGRAINKTVTVVPPNDAHSQNSTVAKGPAMNGLAIIRNTGAPMEYQNHQTVRVFDTGKKKTNRVENFETQLRMAPIVKPVKDAEPEILRANPDGVDMAPIPVLVRTHRPAFSVSECINRTSVEIMMSDFTVPRRNTGIVEWDICVPISVYGDKTSAELDIMENNLGDIVVMPGKTPDEIGIVEWHERLSAAKENATSRAATDMLSVLDKIATDEFNSFLKCVLGLPGTVESFIDDFDEFYDAVNETIGEETLLQVLGDSPQKGIKVRNTAGGRFVGSLSNIRMVPLGTINDEYEGDSGFAMVMYQPVTVVQVGESSDVLSLAITTNAYNSISEQKVNDDHVTQSILEMFSIAAASRPFASVYVANTDLEYFHMREFVLTNKKETLLHIGIRHCGNSSTISR